MSASDFEAQLVHLPDYFSSHVLLTLGAVAIGCLISLPLAFLALRKPTLRTLLLGAASIVQTIPGLALLALMVPLLGRIGVVPALVALVLYSMLPVLRNTVTGVQGVDAAVLEAARGIGMTDGQILTRVQIPLAAPMIVAGVRTAAVWTVGMATLSTPVGATSLGNYIFSGLQTQNTAAVVIGCVAAATLAIGLDGLIRLAQLAAERRDGRLTLASLLLLATLVGLSSAPVLGRWLRRDDAPHAIVGAKTFTEQYILADLISNRLRDAGFDVELREGLGSTVAFDALVTGDIDVYVDYSGTLWTNQMKRAEHAGDSPSLLAEMRSWLESNHGISLLGTLGFENAYALAMRRERADALGIANLSDLAERSRNLAIGADYEFFARPEWGAVRDRYAMMFREQRTFDSTLMYRAVVDGHVDVISAFSSDGRVSAFDLVVLEDPLQAFPPYDAVVLLSQRAARRPALVAALLPLIGSIDDARMRGANELVDVGGRSISEAAHSLEQDVRR